MHLLHFTSRRRIALHAEGLLVSSEAARTDERIAACGACRRDFEALRAVVRLLEGDEARSLEAPISSGAMASRVRARLRESADSTLTASPRPRTALSSAAALAAVGAAAVLVGIGLASLRSDSSAPAETTTVSVAFEPVQVADDEAAFLERLEREQVRVSAARYLSDAQDVLVHVAALSDDCADPRHRHDGADGGLSHEAERSRALLMRRARLAPEQHASLAAARSVIADVEGVLRQVAELPRCTRREDLDAIRESLDRKRLLMKIDLVSQELAG